MDYDLIENVFRVQTDGIVLNCDLELKMDEMFPVPEAKTTGLILWKNVNSYCFADSNSSM